VGFFNIPISKENLALFFYKIYSRLFAVNY